MYKSQKFRKVPVVIEAFRWNEGSFHLAQCPNLPEWAGDRVSLHENGMDAEIETLEGTMRAKAGDWILRGVSGEVYPCKPDIFDKTYETVS